MTYIEALQDIQNQDLNCLTNKSLQLSGKLISTTSTSEPLLHEENKIREENKA
jgi:hypothetical protein